MRFCVLLSALLICSCSLTQFKEWAVPETSVPNTSKANKVPAPEQNSSSKVVNHRPSVKEKYSCAFNASADDAVNFIQRFAQATYHEQDALNEKKVTQINKELTLFVDSDYIQKHYLYKSLYVFPFYDEHSATPEVTCVMEEGALIAVYVALNTDGGDAVQVNKFTLKRDERGILSIVPQQPPSVVPKGVFSAKQERTNWSPRLYLRVPEVVYKENLSAQLQ
ncbi:hypothetical protein [Alteromonas sp. ASW11-130]|uniref:hypothetical protein n=1 Tax=Alteromonas sp. ASW11-130 TaxID=3015775 RepID=UPI00224240C2|nr:hypothetical protein [Alteromonas sp. ASW11-130]MCW8092380.1 hypothetical protein [Alteromonas sp. ASW11-130]